LHLGEEVEIGRKACVRVYVGCKLTSAKRRSPCRAHAWRLTWPAYRTTIWRAAICWRCRPAAPADLLDARLRLVADARARSAERPAGSIRRRGRNALRVTLLDSDELRPGQSAGCSCVWIARLPYHAATAIFCASLASLTLAVVASSISTRAPSRFRPKLAPRSKRWRAAADLLLRALDDAQPHEWAALLKASELPAGARLRR